MMRDAWEVTYYDEDAGVAYRVATQRMTVRDGIRLGELEDTIAARDDLEGRALLALAHYYPLLACGTRNAERAALTDAPAVSENGAPIVPEDAAWEPLELTEGQFLDLPDYLMWAWYTSVIQKNPQYDRSYEVLKKNLARLMRPKPNAPGPNESAPAASVTETASSGD